MSSGGRGAPLPRMGPRAPVVWMGCWAPFCARGVNATMPAAPGVPPTVFAVVAPPGASVGGRADLDGRS
eukprot:2529682-Lingulodinium_polyedra.AAC.1